MKKRANKGRGVLGGISKRELLLDIKKIVRKEIKNEIPDISKKTASIVIRKIKIGTGSW